MTRRDVRLKDLAQLPTAITAVSLGAVIKGSSKLDTRQGKLLVMAGRAGDLLDGAVARRYNMSSDAGAIADATSDKLGLLAIGAGMWRHDLAPKPLLAAMTAKHVVNAGATIHAGLTDSAERSIRPQKSGKFAMAADSLSLSAFLLADELTPDSSSQKIARGIGYAAAITGFAFGAHAAWHYLKDDFATDDRPQ